MSPSNAGLHGQPPLRFERFGSAYHLQIKNAQDLEAVLDLDEAHWVATTAPTATLNCDPVFLSMIDTDNNGRLRAEEIKDAIRYMFKNLSDFSDVLPENTRLSLDAVNRRSETGGRIHSSALKMCRRMEIP